MSRQRRLALLPTQLIHYQEIDSLGTEDPLEVKGAPYHPPSSLPYLFLTFLFLFPSSRSSECLEGIMSSSLSTNNLAEIYFVTIVE